MQAPTAPVLAATLPKEVLQVIFGFLSPVELVQSAIVCKHWHVISCLDYILRPLWERDFALINPNAPALFIGFQHSAAAEAAGQLCFQNYRALYTQLEWNWWQFLRGFVEQADAQHALIGLEAALKQKNLGEREKQCATVERDICFNLAVQLLLGEGLQVDMAGQEQQQQQRGRFFANTADEWARILLRTSWKFPFAPRRCLALWRLQCGQEIAYNIWQFHNDQIDQAIMIAYQVGGPIAAAQVQAELEREEEPEASFAIHLDELLPAAMED
jgi:hypothetical protein